MIGHALSAARRAAKLTVDELAALADVDSASLERFEQGDTTLSSLEVDRSACALGFRIEDLETWTGKELTLPVLLRDSLESDLDLSRGLARELYIALGEFQRTVRNIAALEALLASGPKALPAIASAAREGGGRRGEELAIRVREHMKLGIDPIPSMRKLVEETLDISVVWVTTEHLDSRIDGASTSTPRPAILVNLFEANRYPWRARTTLAHELCHVLFDHGRRGTLFSPNLASVSQTVRDALGEIETVARAFSACFLAPSDGISRAVGSIDPTSEQAIRRIGETFGVGRQVAVNRLCQVFHLAREQRAAMESRVPEHYAADFSGDEVVMVDGFRGEPLRTLVRKALVTEKIRPARARHILGLSATDALPFPDLGELSAPTVTRLESIRRIAQAVLRERYPREGLEALGVEEMGGGFRVSIVAGGVGCFEPRARGCIEVTAAGEVKRVDVSGGTEWG